MINKSETYDSTINGISKARSAGIKCSVMIINGLGGKEFTKQHAENSAKLINEIQPEYLSTLVLSFPFGRKHYIGRLGIDFVPLKINELLIELQIFISMLELSSTIFRSDHASNYLTLKGILNKDKERLLSTLEYAINSPDDAPLRPEWMRGL